jgi:hypothetical protein
MKYRRRCPECGALSWAVGPFRVCRNLDCPRLVMGEKR